MTNDLGSVWSALGSPHRRKLLDRLADGPRTTGELAAEFPELSRYAVMQHLGVLEASGLIMVRREGRYRYNYLNPVPVRRIYERWIRPLSERVAVQTLALEGHILSSKEPAVEQKADRLVKIEAEARIAATPEAIFQAFTTGLNAWWPHRTRGDAVIVYEAGIGGRVFEDWGGGSGMLYGNVALYDPPHRHVLIRPGLNGRPYMIQSSESVDADGDATIYRKTLVMWGEVSEEMEEGYRQGVATVTERMKEHVEERSVAEG